jgi:hypothetical protein
MEVRDQDWRRRRQPTRQPVRCCKKMKIDPISFVKTRGREIERAMEDVGKERRTLPLLQWIRTGWFRRSIRVTSAAVMISSGTVAIGWKGEWFK